jgi:hypothetical protein
MEVAMVIAAHENFGMKFFFVVAFIGFCALAIGIADGGNAGIIGLGLLVVAAVGVSLSS